MSKEEYIIASRKKWLSFDKQAFQVLIDCNMAAVTADLIVAYAITADFSTESIDRKREQTKVQRGRLNDEKHRLSDKSDNLKAIQADSEKQLLNPEISDTLRRALKSELTDVSTRRFKADCERWRIQGDIKSIEHDFIVDESVLNLFAWIGLDHAETAFYTPYLSSLGSPVVFEVRRGDLHRGFDPVESAELHIQIGTVGFTSGAFAAHLTVSSITKLRYTPATFAEMPQIAGVLNTPLLSCSPLGHAIEQALLDPWSERSEMYKFHKDVHPITMLVLFALDAYARCEHKLKSRLSMPVDIDRFDESKVRIYESKLKLERIEREQTKGTKARKDAQIEEGDSKPVLKRSRVASAAAMSD